MSKKEKPKYHVYYVVDTKPNMKSFTSKETMDLWVSGFKEACDHNGYVSWIDLIIKGELLENNVA